MQINKIKVNKRFRKDLGELESLKQSIQKIGLLQPIVVDEQNNLIAGFRRLSAFKELGKKEIDVNVVNIENAVQGEYDENIIRKNFTPSERVAIWDSIENFQFKKGRRSDSEQREKPIKQVSKITGISTDTLSKAKQVVEFGDKKLIEKMDKTGNVNRIYRQVKAKKLSVERKLLTPKNITVDVQCGDFRILSKKINNNTIDLILTDPPYPKEYLPLWAELGKIAKRILKPSGFLISYSGQNNLPFILGQLSNHLNYYWLGSLYHSGSLGQRFESHFSHGSVIIYPRL